MVKGRKTAASPVKDKLEVNMIYSRFIKWGMHREAELFVIGCNVALRISDLLKIKFTDIKTRVKDGQLVGYISYLEEQKTSKNKSLTFNHVAMLAVNRLRERFPDHIYLFQATGNRVGSSIQPVSRSWVNKALAKVKEALGLDYPLSSHSMRKTFGYHAYKDGADINVLQKLFNHSCRRETFIYIGITQERVSDTYINFAIEVTA